MKRTLGGLKMYSNELRCIIDEMASRIKCFGYQRGLRLRGGQNNCQIKPYFPLINLKDLLSQTDDMKTC